MQLFDFAAATESFATRCFTLNVCMRSKDSAQQRKVKKTGSLNSETYNRITARTLKEKMPGTVSWLSF